MLYEIKDVQQEESGPFCRWFADRDFDLFVWYNEDDSFFGFQLCYEKGKNEKALTWKAKSGFGVIVAMTHGLSFGRGFTRETAQAPFAIVVVPVPVGETRVHRHHTAGARTEDHGGDLQLTQQDAE